ncbi:hypothetical protein JADG_005892 [Aureobasidium aubasidani]|nr:hypothetical protein JADG_005892 [Aureobasidium pullulans]
MFAMDICRQITKHVAARVSTLSLVLAPTTNPRLISTYPPLDRSTEDSEPRLMSSTASAMWNRRKYANDSAWREEKVERIILREKLRIKEDPIFRAKKQAQSAAFYAEKLEKVPYFKVLRDIRNWIDCFPAIREQLHWQYHDLAWSPQKVSHRCASCNHKRTRGQKLWLQRRTCDSDTEQFDCWACFTSDPQRALPEGFKDITTIEQLRARKKQLFGVTVHTYSSSSRIASLSDSP